MSYICHSEHVYDSDFLHKALNMAEVAEHFVFALLVTSAFAVNAISSNRRTSSVQNSGD